MVLRTVSVKINTFLLKQKTKQPMVSRRPNSKDTVSDIHCNIRISLILISRELIFANRHIWRSKMEFIFANLAKIRKIREIFFPRKFLSLKYVLTLLCPNLVCLLFSSGKITIFACLITFHTLPFGRKQGLLMMITVLVLRNLWTRICSLHQRNLRALAIEMYKISTVMA